VTLKKLPQSAQIGITVAALLVVAVLGYFVLVRPQKSTASDLSKQVAAEQKQVDDARALLVKAKDAQKVRVADLFRLTKAMPDQPDEAGIVLELNNVARQAGISFDSIAPQGSTPLSGYQVVPINVVFNGNFFQLNDFLFRLRNLVDVRRGALAADGRLFTVDNIGFDEGELKFPQIQASLTIDAYIYGTGATVSAPPQAAAQGTPGSSTTPGSTTATTTSPTTTSTTTTSPTTTTTPGATAAPGAGGAN